MNHTEQMEMAVLSACALGMTVACTDSPRWWILVVVAIGYAAGWILGRRAHR